MSGYDRENRNVLRRCLKTASDGVAVTWAGRSFHTVAPEELCECATADCGWTNDRYVQAIRAGGMQSSSWRLWHEWSRTGSNSVQRREWLVSYNVMCLPDMLKLPIWRRCAQGYAADEGWWMSAGEMCSERRKPKMSGAVAFCTNWRRRISEVGRPYSTLLQ